MVRASAVDTESKKGLLWGDLVLLLQVLVQLQYQTLTQLGAETRPLSMMPHMDVQVLTGNSSSACSTR